VKWLKCLLTSSWTVLITEKTQGISRRFEDLLERTKRFRTCTVDHLPLSWQMQRGVTLQSRHPSTDRRLERQAFCWHQQSFSGLPFHYCLRLLYILVLIGLLAQNSYLWLILRGNCMVVNYHHFVLQNWLFKDMTLVTCLGSVLDSCILCLTMRMDIFIKHTDYIHYMIKMW
jgi:hypothetical protein